MADEEKAAAENAATEDISALEDAAEKVGDPGSIEHACRTEKKLHFAKSDLFGAAIWVIGIILLLGGEYFVSWHRDMFGQQQRAINIEKYLHGAALAALVLLGAKLIDIFAIGRLANAVTRYNLKRVLRLAAGLAIAGIAVSVLFANWRAAVVSLGLVSLILGFALQTPISSFIGWIYILVRRPYRVGDRIKINDLRGDVIDVNYLDTTLWEFGGEYLSGDHPSGRVIKFPNSSVFNNAVINYSWPLFPYIWNEIKFHVAYETDLEFMSKTMYDIVVTELGEDMMAKVKQYREILAKTPVDHLEVNERPVVYFRVSDNTWLEAIVRYLVHPREAGHVKTSLIRKLLKALNAAPDRVLFPKSNAR